MVSVQANAEHALVQSDSTLELCEKLQQKDQDELKERHAKIAQILDIALSTAGEPNHRTDQADTQVDQIWELAEPLFTQAGAEDICSSWRTEMADLNRRLRSHWTQAERTSLTSLLTRFEEVLRHLLHLLPAGSVYEPMAREASDQGRAVKLFVGGASSA